MQYVLLDICNFSPFLPFPITQNFPHLRAYEWNPRCSSYSVACAPWLYLEARQLNRVWWYLEGRWGGNGYLALVPRIPSLTRDLPDNLVFVGVHVEDDDPKGADAVAEHVCPETHAQGAVRVCWEGRGGGWVGQLLGWLSCWRKGFACMWESGTSFPSDFPVS